MLLKNYLIIFTLALMSVPQELYSAEQVLNLGSVLKVTHIISVTLQKSVLEGGILTVDLAQLSKLEISDSIKQKIFQCNMQFIQ